METSLLAGLGMAGIYALSKNNDPRKNPQKGDPYLRQNHPHYSNNPSNYGMGNDNRMIEKHTDYALENGSSGVNDYHNGNQTTDQFFDLGNFGKVGTERAEQTMQGPSFKSLSGDTIHTNDFYHSNMAPFFGGKIRGAGPDVNTSELYLDSKVGGGSQHFSKREQAPLFKPQKDLHWVSGMPNQNDFLQSRVNTSNMHNNCKPWEEVRVGPSLSGKPGIEGSGGFNSGLEYRESYMPKTVDELRTESNPKMTYSLINHEGAAVSTVKNRGELGEYTYQGPDKFFVNTTDRYLVTTGNEKAPRGRGVFELKDQSRTETSREYTGCAGKANNVQAAMAPHNYDEPRRQPIYGMRVEGPAYASGHNVPTSNDYSYSSYKLAPNNRSTTEQNTVFGAVKSVISSIMSPIVETMRPTRKENIVGNMIDRGNVGKAAHDGIYFVSPDMSAKTTYREMNPAGKQHVFVGNQHENHKFIGNNYTLNEPAPQHRDTTSHSYTGNAKSGNTGIQLQGHVRDNPRLNNNRIVTPARFHGNTNVLNTYVNNTRETARGQYNYNTVGQATHNRGMLGPENFAEVTTQTNDYRGFDHADRINPDLLQAFKNNPYTHSLTGVA